MIYAIRMQYPRRGYYYPQWGYKSIPLRGIDNNGFDVKFGDFMMILVTCVNFSIVRHK